MTVNAFTAAPATTKGKAEGGKKREHKCGSCTKCCELVAVSDICKPGFTRCIHEGFVPSLRHEGCTIYTNRPRSCAAAWSCLWRFNCNWTDALRPDRCGVVFDPTLDVVTIDGVRCDAVQAWIADGHEYDFKDVGTVRGAVLSLLGAGLALVWHLGPYGYQRSCVIYKRGDTIICSEPQATPITPGRLTATTPAEAA
jgi:hypothetical protein